MRRDVQWSVGAGAHGALKGDDSGGDDPGKDVAEEPQRRPEGEEEQPAPA